MVSYDSIHIPERATSQGAYNTASDSFNLPILLLLLILVHPFQPIAAEAEEAEYDRFDKDASENVAVAKDDIGSCLRNERLTNVIIGALSRALLVEHGSTPDAQYQ